ncbi:MAG: phosphoribosylformylglycinamidine synthase [Alphaproteobacteria bacterium]|nr:MAG: phosphoribosylformylglycinamidine synthase [Alphaproteobacteria bacterium]
MGAAVRIEVSAEIPDRRLEKWTREARDYLDVPLTAIEEAKVYRIAPTASPRNLPAAIKSVFGDPVLQSISFAGTEHALTGPEPSFVAEVSYRPGVTDNPARSAEEALTLSGCPAEVASGSIYFLYGSVNEAGARKVGRELLANELIQKIEIWTYKEFCKLKRFDAVKLPKAVFSHPPKAEEVSLELDDAGLEKLSKDRYLALTLAEVRHIRDYYRDEDVTTGRVRQGLPAQPTDVEIEVLAQTWSEHCKHKIFAAKIDYTGPGGKREQIDSLYKTYIKRATKEIEQERKLDWLISVFSDNAGIVRFDDKIDLCIKVETHNSPSALDPYGGALTGILGVNRDILGCGLGARPIANTDVFCFAPPTMPAKDEADFMPAGPKPPRRILEGVHKGVEDGGNKSGIPTVNGAFFFDRDYAGKPLVFVGTVGALPPKLPDGRPSAQKQLSPGDRIFMVGGAIGADGIHGATFSSLELDDNAPATAVQIGDPLTQKRMADFLLEARDLGLYAAITDNGAGGLSSSVGEMAQMSNGASLDLAKCPVKYPGLSPWELMVSESQERMTVAVSPDKKQAFLDLAKRRGVSATDIGAFDDSGYLTVLYQEKIVGRLSLDFLHNSLPQMQLKAQWDEPRFRAAWSPTTELCGKRRPASTKLRDALLALLQSPNITSKEKWVRAYDHEVQASTHLKPFAGEKSDGPSDAGVIWLKPHGGQSENAVAIGCGLAPRMSLYDPYRMAQFAVDEAVRNVVVAGGDPDKICLLDNFCWPDPVASAKNPEGAYKLGQLVRTSQGLYDICKAYGAPLVSGKDSMKNDFRGKDRRGQEINISCLPTLMVTAMAHVPAGATVGSSFRAANDLIYLLGCKSAQGMSGSEFATLFDVAEDLGPSINIVRNIALYRKLHQALKSGFIRSAHDVSEGGLLTTIAESMIGGRLGASLYIAAANDIVFNEAPGRIVVSVAPEKKAVFETAFKGTECHLIGHVGQDEKLSIAGQEEISLSDIVTAWKKGF